MLVIIMKGQLSSELERELLSRAEEFAKELIECRLDWASCVYEALGDREIADELREKVAKHARDVETPYKAEIYYRAIGKLDEAIKAWKEYADKKAADRAFGLAAEAYERIAEICREQGKLEESNRYYEMAGDFYLEYAKLYAKSDIKWYKIKKEWEVWFEKADRAYRMAGKEEKAKKAWETMVEILRNVANKKLEEYLEFGKEIQLLGEAIHLYEKIAEIYAVRIKDPEKAKEAWAIEGLLIFAAEKKKEAEYIERHTIRHVLEKVYGRS